MSITLDGDVERLQRIAKDLRGRLMQHYRSIMVLKEVGADLEVVWCAVPLPNARHIVMTAWREVAGVNDSNGIHFVAKRILAKRIDTVPMKQLGKGRKPSCK